MKPIENRPRELRGNQDTLDGEGTSQCTSIALQLLDLPPDVEDLPLHVRKQDKRYICHRSEQYIGNNFGIYTVKMESDYSHAGLPENTEYEKR